MGTNRIATLKDVALLADVSQATVSRAFTESANLAPETREKVMSAARALNYFPNALAQGLANNRSNFIGVVKGYTKNIYFNELLSEIVYILQEEEKKIIYFEAEQNVSTETMTDVILKYQPEGMVFLNLEMSSELAVHCKQRGIATVQFHRYSTVSEANAILPDNFGASAEAARLFVDRGFESFVFIAGEINSSSNEERQKAFCDELRLLGANAPAIWQGDYTYESGHELAKLYGKELRKGTAILCGNDMMAMGVIDGLRGESDLVMGRDIIMISFDNVNVAAWDSYLLSTFTHDRKKMARDGIDLLLEEMKNPGTPPTMERHPLILIERGTTGA